MAHKEIQRRKSPVGSDFNDTVIQMLREDVAFREEYIKETLSEKDPQALIISLRRIIDAVGGIGWLSKQTGLNRTQLYRTVSKDGKPEYFTLTKILNVMGMHFTVERNSKKRSKLAKSVV
jgi:probable addiction module antidote protein